MKFTRLIVVGLFLFWNSAYALTVTYSDMFNTVSYANNDGSQSFSDGWVETGETTDSSAGTIQIVNGHLEFNVLTGQSISRRVDLSDAVSFTLTFNVTEPSNTRETLSVEFYNKSTGQWNEVIAVTASATPASVTVTDSVLMSNLSEIRFISGTGNWGRNDIYQVDDLVLTATYDDAVIATLTDTDNDGVVDRFDLDDDNDGILDSTESLIDLAVFDLTGDASQISLNEIQLTPAASNQFGSAMSKNTISLLNGFTIDAEVYLGTNDSGADGMAFVLHNDPRGSNAIGNGEGSTLGALANATTAGIANGISIEFDTYQSSGNSDDITNDHTQIRDTDIAYDSTAGRITNVTSLGNIEDGNWHTFQAEWDPDTNELYYRIDGVVMPGISGVDLANAYFNNSSDVYFGFTAATGGAVNEQKIRNVQSTELKDSDGDGIYNSLDLDSDNDGIPDNVEAQASAAFVYSSTPPVIDAEGRNIAYGTSGLSLTIDTDADGIVDYADTDSDGDTITDCVEGMDDVVAVSKSCPITVGMVGNNGLASWAETTDDYVNVSGKIVDPLSELLDEISGNSEAAYREIACGPAEIDITAYQWKTISMPCNTGTNDISTLFGASLGTYGEPETGGHWVMYEQGTAYDGKSSDTTKLDATSTVVPGRGYWIISDQTVTAKIAKPLANIGPTLTVSALSYGISSTTFEQVMEYALPDSNSVDVKKVMIGNPFLKKFQLSDVFYQHGTASFVSTATLITGGTMEPVVYTHDSTSADPYSYIAITPDTPGFTDEVAPMIGYWIKLNAGNTNTNTITFPFEK